MGRGGSIMINVGFIGFQLANFLVQKTTLQGKLLA